MRECWFDPFLPDLNWWNEDVSNAMLADMEYWYTRYKLDGLRVDAVPMMPRNAVRLLRNQLGEAVTGERPFSWAKPLPMKTDSTKSAITRPGEPQQSV